VDFCERASYGSGLAAADDVLPDRVVGSGTGGGAAGVRAGPTGSRLPSAAMRLRLADVLGFAERGTGAGGGGVGGGGCGDAAGADCSASGTGAGGGSVMIEGSGSGRTKPKDMSSTMWRLWENG
jgi:hypothetical protein